MQIRRLALLGLAACASQGEPALEHESPAPGDSPLEAVESPVPSDSPLEAVESPVPGDSPLEAVESPVPSDSPADDAHTSGPGRSLAPGGGARSPAPLPPPRLLHPGVYGFAALADGDLLIDPHPWFGADEVTDDLQRLDPDTGARSPWPLDWRPEPLGWRLQRGSAPEVYPPQVSPDGRWIALQVGFEPRSSPDPWTELVAVVLTRGDGSDPRCIGVGVPSDDLPPLAWSADSSRLVGDWSVQCSPDARGRALAITGEASPDPRPMRWFDVGDASRGEQPGDGSDFHYHRDPLGDVELAQRAGDDDEWAWWFYDFKTGARLGAVPRITGTGFDVLGWVSPDALLIDHGEPDGPGRQHLLRLDGRSLDAPDWRVYTRLPGGEVLLSRDGGRSVEQATVDWQSFRVEHSRPRPDLVMFTAPGTRDSTWRPGLGGVLIHREHTGELYLAAI